MVNDASAEKTVNQSQAKIVFEKAETDYRLSRFVEALGGYTKAYELYPVAEFLFNIGQCHRNLNNYEKAIFSFNAYVRDADSPGAQLRVKKLIASLKQSLDKAKVDEKTAQKAIGQEVQVPPSTGATRAAKAKEASDKRSDDILSIPVPPPGVPQDEDVHPTVYSNWWLWTAVLIASVAVGGGIYVASRPDDLPEGALGAVDWQ